MRRVHRLGPHRRVDGISDKQPRRAPSHGFGLPSSLWPDLVPRLFCRVFASLLLLAVADRFGSTITVHAAKNHGRDQSCFTIRVVDEQTGRGVPMVEIKTVHDVSWWTDSAGIVAFDEPGLMGLEVFFHVSSPGYEYPKDAFGNRGLKLKPKPGGRAELNLRRLNIAERLYRITGAGIYRDSLLAGVRPALKHPVLNGQVMGQDTVVVTPYRGKLYWFWGDTQRVSYPLGNFGASGATSKLPRHGGLDPGVGVDLSYFIDKSGFSKPMCPEAGFERGLQWIEFVLTLRDEKGRERLLARIASGTGMLSSRAWHLAMFDDEKEVFQSVARWEIHDTHDSSHPFKAQVGGVDYFYLYPNYRVPSQMAALRDLGQYEAFTCIGSDGRLRGAQTGIDRDASGRARYSWKAGADRLHPGALGELIRLEKLRVGEPWFQLHDIETGSPVPGGRGSVFWNDYRQRWIMIVSGSPGEIWFSEADDPVGPWVYARRVLTHGRYNFYNPTQHPFFDQDNGRIIYFEGTYTESFSGAPAKTPRYEYNQLMYRITLDDPRLSLPVPVYRVRGTGAASHLMQREQIEKDRAWDQVEGIAFFAIPPHRSGTGLVPVYAAVGESLVQTNAPTGQSMPLFFAMPPDSNSKATNSSTLTEELNSPDRQPLCRVWKNVANRLTFDWRSRTIAEPKLLPLSKPEG